MQITTSCAPHQGHHHHHRPQTSTNTSASGAAAEVPDHAPLPYCCVHHHGWRGVK